MLQQPRKITTSTTAISGGRFSNSTITSHTVSSSKTSQVQTQVSLWTANSYGAIATGLYTTTLPTNQKNNKLSSGTVAGISIGTAVIGALLATAVLLMIVRGRKSRRGHGSNRGLATSRKADESMSVRPKSVLSEKVNKPMAVDIDYLFQQPHDDRTVGSQVRDFFAAIDAHVESFFIDTPLQDEHVHENDVVEKSLLVDPVTRLFAAKKIICMELLEAINLDCPTQRSLLPCSITHLSRKLRAENINDRALTIAWSRFRTSFTFLLKPEPDSVEMNRLEQATSTIVERLNHQLSGLVKPGTSTTCIDDLTGLCQSAEHLGRTILSQPAVWKFDWTVPGGNGRAHPSARSDSGPHRSRMVYFPALLRLTDNKAEQLRSAHQVLSPKMVH